MEEDDCMGDRYYVTVQCPVCKKEEKEVYYAPTCGFVAWTCPKCSHVVDLEEYTGISYEDASNREELEEIVKAEERVAALMGYKG